MRAFKPRAGSMSWSAAKAAPSEPKSSPVVKLKPFAGQSGERIFADAKPHPARYSKARRSVERDLSRGAPTSGRYLDKGDAPDAGTGATLTFDVGKRAAPDVRAFSDHPARAGEIPVWQGPRCKGPTFYPTGRA